MYVPLGVQAQFWFRPRVELDSRLGPSPSLQALKVVRETNKKHLRFLAQHEQELLRRIDPEDANHIYMQLGLKRPEPGEDPCSEFSNKDPEPYRRGDLEPITVVGLRSHHHPVAEVQAQSFSTWLSMRDQYYADQQQAATANVSSWVVQTDDAFSETGSWSTHEAPDSEWSAGSCASASGSGSGSEWCDDDVQWDLQGSNWSDEGDTNSHAEERSDQVRDQVPALSEHDHWTSGLPTPPPSDSSSLPSSPVLSKSQMTPETATIDANESADSASEGSDITAIEELTQVLNDRKIMETFLDGIARRIKDYCMSKSEKEAEKAAERQRYGPVRQRRQKQREQERGDPKRGVRFRRNLTMLPEQTKLHRPEEACREYFETHFQMTHVYEDEVGQVHAEPVATEGLPRENQYEWMKGHREL
ncbi:hypothetical protein J7T55_005041 [Diaporthe amygdali]|uniref:uncharacterized protein n=1 Tax=Phomopsis amygdali TaxID=1214568 RepID=UPI0022FE4E0E|nr:uncharacterized protein J7T55_005041 [Diaporthe amygdali]KAJ0116095.1 hypothetical protein J7T55_005041 [Diaporthe amygdali]